MTTSKAPGVSRCWPVVGIFAIAPAKEGLLLFFFFNETATTEIYTLSLHDALPISGVMCQPYFPITPDELHGTVRFHGAGNEDFAVNVAKVRSRWIRHTSPTVGFRVDVEGVSVAYVSDHGPGCSDDPDEFIPSDVLELADGADLLIHDAQHTCEEFENKRHFGHSTVDYAVHVARESGARRLMLYHHCPSHSDDNVDLMHLYTSALAERVAGGLEVLAAREGLVVELQNALVR